MESESLNYGACHFQLNGMDVICRTGKITPKKVGQFVTFWKRKGAGVIEPFNEFDQFDFLAVNVRNEKHFGQFVFPKSVLILKDIISSNTKEGKRAFRVYPPWDTTKNKQSERTQQWQLDYFYEIDHQTDLKKVVDLYKKNR